MKRKGGDLRDNPNFEKSEKKSPLSYMADPKLLPRVEQYLASQKNRRHVSIGSMADDLQTRYGEYSRKKKTAFRKSVTRAYEIVCANNKDKSDFASDLEKKFLEKRRKKDQESGSEDSDSEASFSDDNPDYVQVKDTNSMNSFMTDLYKKPKRVASASTLISTPCTTPSSPRHPSSGNNTPMPGSPCRKSCPSSPQPWYEDQESEDQLMFTIDRTGDMHRKSDLANLNKTNSNVSSTLSPKAKVKRSSVSSTKSPLAKVINSDVVLPETRTVSGDKKKVGLYVDKIDKDVLESDAANQEDKTDAKVTRKVRKKATEREGKKKGPEIQQSVVKFADVGGNEATLKEVCQLLVHLKHPEVYHALGVTPPRGFLLHGPPGCGKTLLANAIAGELELPFIKMAATEIVSGVSGESEEKLRDVFDKAVASAPCILFLDEIDAITQKRETASKDMERRIVSQLLSCMDDLNTKSMAHVLVIGATNRLDSLDPALRRAGRFDREIPLGIPDEQARKRILQVLCRGLRLASDFEFLRLAHLTPGFVGADLTALAREAAITAVNRVFCDLQSKSQAGLACAYATPADITMVPIHQHELPVQSQALASSAVTSEPTVTRTDSPNTVADIIDVDSSTVNPTPAAVPSNMDVSPETAAGVPSAEAGVSHPELCAISSQHDAQSHGQIPRTGEWVTNERTNVLPTQSELETWTVAASSSNPVQPVAVEAGASVSSVQSGISAEQTRLDSELNSVLYWLKEQPPLTEEQLKSLWITMEDFEAALKVVQPSAKREGFATIPDVTWDDIGALQDVREELQMAILAPVKHPEQFQALGLTNPPGVLLAGPPGCGKTLLAKAIANESGINFISVKGPELLNMYVGESERAVRQVFQRARNSSPCVIFFDELDALCPRRSDSGEGGSTVRVVNQLLTEMDGLEARKQVFIMAATNRPDIIDPAILRPGRLDKTLYVGLPTAADRWDILKTITKKGTRPHLDHDVDLKSVADNEKCEGYTGADMAALVREAAVIALREYMANSQGSQHIIVSSRHFDLALIKIKPSVSHKDQLIYSKIKRSAAPS